MMPKNKCRSTIKKNLSDLYTNETKPLIEKDFLAHKYLETNSEYKKSTHIFSYLSMKQEAPTTSIIAQAYNSDKQILLPRIQVNEMDFYYCNVSTQFTKNPYGIIEPFSSDSVNIKHLLTTDKKAQLIFIVPGLAFTKSGKRLGRGKGYYDRYLSKALKTVADAKKRICIIGLCHSIQIMEDIPTEKHDISMNYILCENAIYDCKDF